MLDNVFQSRIFFDQTNYNYNLISSFCHDYVSRRLSTPSSTASMNGGSRSAGILRYMYAPPATSVVDFRSIVSSMEVGVTTEAQVRCVSLFFLKRLFIFFIKLECFAICLNNVRTHTHLHVFSFT